MQGKWPLVLLCVVALAIGVLIATGRRVPSPQPTLPAIPSPVAVPATPPPVAVRTTIPSPGAAGTTIPSPGAAGSSTPGPGETPDRSWMPTESRTEQGSRPSSAPGLKYGWDASTVTSVSGEVVDVGQFRTSSHAPSNLRAENRYVLLRAGAEQIVVRLGPANFVDSLSVPLAAGDRISVVGSQVVYGERKGMVAGQVTKGDQTMKLRDERGVPLWLGIRRAQSSAEPSGSAP